MEYVIRDICETDLGEVLALNQQETPYVGSVDLDRMRWFARTADAFRVACSADRIVGYLVGLLPGSDYDSPNYCWFCERYDDFAYIDRVAVATTARRSGLASRLYDDFLTTVARPVPRMACEVNIRPPNEPSLRFHRRLGFEQVGTRAYDGGDKVVAMLVKTLAMSKGCKSGE